MGDVLQEISRPSPLMKGGADLMGALLGGGRVEEAARQKEEQRLLQNQGLQAGVDRKITQAMLERDKRTAQQRYVNDLVALGTAPEMARVQGDTMIGGDSNLAQAQQFDMRHRAEAALHADPNITEANAILGALAGKPLVSTAVQGGEVIGNRYGAAPTITDTGLTAAKIGAENARAGMANAHAGVYNAQTAAGGYSNGNPRAPGGAGKPEKFSNAPQALLLAALDAPGADGKRSGYVEDTELAPFAQWRTAHPEFANGTEALNAYLSTRGLPNIHPIAQAADYTGEGGVPLHVPAGADPDLASELLSVALDGQRSGHPVSPTQLRSMAEIRARGHEYGVDPNGRVVVSDGGAAPAARPTPAHGTGIGDVVMNALKNLLPGGQAVPAAPANPVLADAQSAIAKGADPAKVRARLIQLGHADLAGQL